MITNIHIIIPTLGYSEMLMECIDSIEKNTSIDHEILLVNTKSKEEDKDISGKILEKYGNVKCSNTGFYHFAKTNNEAVFTFLSNIPDEDFVVFCNNDIVFQSDCIKNMKCVFDETPSVGTVGAFLFFEDGTIQHAGVGLDEKTINCYHIGYKQKCPPELLQNLSLKKYSKTIANTAALMMMNVWKFKKLNGFNEDYKVCFEDLDLNLRATMDFGWNNYVSYNAIALHKESSSRGKDLNRLDVYRIRYKMAEFMYKMENNRKL